MTLRLRSSGAASTEDLGRRLAAMLGPGMVVYLEGELGAGKTTLVRGILRGLGYPGTVRSPTYTLLEHYDTRPLPACHVDLYRLADASELEALALRDYLDGQTLCLVEWPERGSGHLPAPDVRVQLAGEGDRREVALTAVSPSAAGVVTGLAAGGSRGA